MKDMSVLTALRITSTDDDIIDTIKLLCSEHLIFEHGIKETGLDIVSFAEEIYKSIAKTVDAKNICNQYAFLAVTLAYGLIASRAFPDVIEEATNNKYNNNKHIAN